MTFVARTSTTHHTALPLEGGGLGGGEIVERHANAFAREADCLLRFTISPSPCPLPSREGVFSWILKA